MIKNKAFYKNVIAITIPIAIQNLISMATSLMDTVMLGRADNTGVFLSGSSLANQPFFILSIINFGLASAATVLAAQYWGRRDTKSIRTIFSIMLKTAFVFASVMAAAVLTVPEKIMGLYSNNPEIISAGTDYLRIIGWAYFLFGLSNTMICMIRSVELVKISVIVNLSSFITNVFLNWVLIFGNLGAPALGIRGAAIATLTARILEFIITFTYIFFIDKRLCFKPRDLFRFDKTFAKDLLKHGSPVFINEFIWSLGTTLQSAILGHIDYAAGDPVAANSIASMTQQLSTVIIFGIANAAAVIIGKSVGEKSFSRAYEEAKALKVMSYIVGAAACIMILLLKNTIVTFYTVPPQTKALANQLMIAVAFITFFVSISSITIVGILRGGGDTRFCLITEMTALWVIALPLALSGMLLKLPVAAVLLLMKIDEPLKSIICIIRINRNRWMKSLTRDLNKT